MARIGERIGELEDRETEITQLNNKEKLLPPPPPNKPQELQN